MMIVGVKYIAKKTKYSIKEKLYTPGEICLLAPAMAAILDTSTLVRIAEAMVTITRNNSIHSNPNFKIHSFFR